MTIEERNKFIEENIKLAYWFYHKYPTDETLSIAFETLINAADRFDPKLGAFSSYYARAAKSNLMRHLYSRKPSVSFEAYTPDYLMLQDNKLPVEDLVILREEIREGFRRMTDRQRRDICKYAQGYTITEIANKNESRQTVFNRIKRAREKMGNYKVKERGCNCKDLQPV